MLQPGKKTRQIPNNKNQFTLYRFRQVSVNDGHELSFHYSCQFYEVSAAENYAGVSLAFQSLLREARSAQLLRALPIRRKLGVNSVSKVIHIIYIIIHFTVLILFIFIYYIQFNESFMLFTVLCSSLHTIYLINYNFQSIAIAFVFILFFLYFAPLGIGQHIW